MLFRSQEEVGRGVEISMCSQLLILMMIVTPVTYVTNTAVKLRDLEAARESFDRAMRLATQQKDRAAENAIRRAIDDINCTLSNRRAAGADDSDTTRAGIVIYLYLHNTIYKTHQQQMTQAGQLGHKVTLITTPDLS